MKTPNRFFELMCAGQVVAAEHLCQCAKCSCNFDKSKAKSTDAGCSCPNCGTLLDEKGAAKVEDQAAKEIKADGDGDVDAKNATRQPALEAGGPGADYLSARADDISLKYEITGRREDLIAAVQAHLDASKSHVNEISKTNCREDQEAHLDLSKTHMAEVSRAMVSLQAGGPGSGPQGGETRKTAEEQRSEKYDTLKGRAKEFSDHADEKEKEASDHDKEVNPAKWKSLKENSEHHATAFYSHSGAADWHKQAAAAAFDKGDTEAEKFHNGEAEKYKTLQESHYNSGEITKLPSERKWRTVRNGGKVSASNAKPSASLQAGFNGNQHKSAKELAAEHSVAADTASKVAASASKAARNQDPSNKEGMHDQAFTMHTAAKSLHELAAAKHRSAGEEDCAKDHDTAAAGHEAEIQAHKGVIEACGGMAAHGNGAAGLEAGGPGSGPRPGGGQNSYGKYSRGTSYGNAAAHSTDMTEKAEKENTKESHLAAAKAHDDAKAEAEKMFKGEGGKEIADRHQNFSDWHNNKAKAFNSASASDATPAAGLQLDCSACVEAKNFKSVLNPIADGIIMYMPAGTHCITPSQNGRPVTVSVAIDASAAEKLETQRAVLEAGGKKPFFSVQHSTQIAAFWPAEFFWDTRLDATGSLVEGVWARGEWTRAGREAVEGKDFRTFSPTFFVDAIRNDPNRPVQVVCNDEAKANMGALENDPAFQTISPLWAHDASAAGEPKQKPAGVTTERLIVMVHDELRASNPDLQDVVNALSFKYDMRVSANDVARALRGEALEAGGPGSGPRPEVATNKASEHLGHAIEHSKFL